MTNAGATTAHFIRRSKSEYEFNQLAAEITILDQRGRVVWRQRQDAAARPIRWPGVDLGGAPIDVGSYTCKILYGHNRQEVYLPFVFMR